MENPKKSRKSKLLTILAIASALTASAVNINWLPFLNKKQPPKLQKKVQQMQDSIKKEKSSQQKKFEQERKRLDSLDRLDIQRQDSIRREINIGKSLGKKSKPE